MSEAEHLEAEWKPKYNPWAIALVVTLATFMEVLDTSIANVALPHIAGSLGASQDEATWVLTSYLVSNNALLSRHRLHILRLLLLHDPFRPGHRQDQGTNRRRPNALEPAKKSPAGHTLRKRFSTEQERIEGSRLSYSTHPEG